jgi:hypothetical protein
MTHDEYTTLPNVNEQMEKSFEQELAKARRCCDHCANRLIDSKIYFEYGFVSGVKAFTETLTATSERLKKLGDG